MDTPGFLLWFAPRVGIDHLVLNGVFVDFLSLLPFDLPLVLLLPETQLHHVFVWEFIAFSIPGGGQSNPSRHPG